MATIEHCEIVTFRQTVHSDSLDNSQVTASGHIYLRQFAQLTGV